MAHQHRRTARQKRGDFYGNHPTVDYLAPILAASAAWFLLGGPSDGLPGSFDTAAYALYSALASVAGLVMTAAVFVCTMTYQSANILMDRARATFSRELRRNWSSVIGWSLGSALLALSALVIQPFSRNIGLTVAAFAVAILVAKFIRAIFWLSKTLFASEISYSYADPVEVGRPSQGGLKPGTEKRAQSRAATRP